MRSTVRSLRDRGVAQPPYRPVKVLVPLLLLLSVPGVLAGRSVDVTAAGDDDMEVVQCPAEFNLGTAYLEASEWSTEELARYRCKWYEDTRIRSVETELGERSLTVRVTVEQMGGSDVEMKLHVSLVEDGKVLVSKKEGVEVDEGERDREAVHLRMGRDELLESRPELTLGIDRIERD